MFDYSGPRDKINYYVSTDALIKKEKINFWFIDFWSNVKATVRRITSYDVKTNKLNTPSPIKIVTYIYTTKVYLC